MEPLLQRIMDELENSAQVNSYTLTDLFSALFITPFTNSISLPFIILIIYISELKRIISIYHYFYKITPNAFLLISKSDYRHGQFSSSIILLHLEHE